MIRLFPFGGLCFYSITLISGFGVTKDKEKVRKSCKFSIFLAKSVIFANGKIDEMAIVWNDNTIGLLYDKYYRALVAYGCQFVEKEIAEDIVQEVFAVLWERQPKFGGMAQLSTYLYTTVHNMAFNHLRHQTVHNNYRQGIIDNLQEFMLVDDTSDTFNKEEIYRLLFLAIDQLPPRQRDVFLLCMEGKKNKDIAEQLQISAETVKVQKRRAINHLREELGASVLLWLYLMKSIRC